MALGYPRATALAGEVLSSDGADVQHDHAVFSQSRRVVVDEGELTVRQHVMLDGRVRGAGVCRAAVWHDRVHDGVPDVPHLLVSEVVGAEHVAAAGSGTCLGDHVLDEGDRLLGVLLAAADLGDDLADGDVVRRRCLVGRCGRCLHLGGGCHGGTFHSVSFADEANMSKIVQNLVFYCK